jgi:hypothetical protein
MNHSRERGDYYRDGAGEGAHNERGGRSEGLDTMDIGAVLDSFGISADDIRLANEALNRAVLELHNSAMKGGDTDIASAVEAVEEFMLAVVPIKAKALVLAYLMAQFESMKIGYVNLRGLIKKF